MAITTAGLLAVLLAVIVGIVVWVIGSLVRGGQRKAREAGYPSLGAYLRAAPRTDSDKGDAADLFLKGVVICLLGLLFPPLLLIGLFPLFFGGRKLMYASMGLGLADDGEPTPPPRRA